jgi:hypothetical protein
MSTEEAAYSEPAGPTGADSRGIDLALRRQHLRQRDGLGVVLQPKLLRLLVR